MDSFQLTCTDSNLIESFENDNSLRLPTPTPTFQPLHTITNDCNLRSSTELLSSHSLNNEFENGSLFIPPLFENNELIAPAHKLSDTAIQALDRLSKMSAEELDNLMGGIDFDPSFFEEFDPYSSTGAQDDQASATLKPCPLATNPTTDETAPATAQPSPHYIDEPATIGQSTDFSNLHRMSPSLEPFSFELLPPPTILPHPERNPHLLTQDPRERPKRSFKGKEKENRAIAASVARHKRQDMLLALHAAYKKFLGEVEGIGEQFSVKPEKMLQLIKSSSHWNEQRKVNSHNAALHFLKGSTDKDGNKLRGKELHELAKTDPEVQEILNDPLRLQKLKDDVNEHRQKKAQGARTSSNSGAQDICLTIDNLLHEFCNLHLCTGAIGFFFIAPGSRDSQAGGGWGVAGDELMMPFFREVLYQEPWDLASDLQMFGCKLNKTKPHSLAALRSDCANMISSSFRYIKRSKTIGMNYEQYESAIVQNHGVRLLWPKQVNNGVITNPSKLCADDICILHRELELGTCRWVEVGQEEGKMDSTPPENPAPSKKRAARSDKGKSRKKARLEDEPVIDSSSLPATSSLNTGSSPIDTSSSTAVSTSTPASSNSISHGTTADCNTQTSGVNLSNSSMGSGDPTAANPSPSTSVINTNLAVAAPATKRRRGRPRKVQNSDPSTVPTVNAPKKRGRPKKTVVVYKSSDLVNDTDSDDDNDGDCNEVN
ncbi:hypothetical protein K435DRAFT_870713 [Dendrothele bispora CBS 962.96]|uniref:Uncharacterized protein n=1 Tax=Dendrothele bispora (strain CBS 962.96) TaxID=1314807 RepID=A0A4V4HCN7_DENBC|nr:hypothetical protein K435DRAFT_870713 [Dendrothele bispora CBS 962.96]